LVLREPDRPRAAEVSRGRACESEHSGLAWGLLPAAIGASTIRAFLLRVQPLDPATLAGVAALILVLAMAVSLRPARAARVDLSQVLRDE
jgi:hypothetical protein